ncbi:putative phosphodiesterase [Desulfitispora alkaliphila]|uniref:metallophosphoesterase family protein n=1 Tax=Desulfitispora alkaliphila TaxID=622674 RepID=UPI003D21341F
MNKAKYIIMVLFFSIVGALLFVSIMGNTQEQINAFEFNLGLQVAHNGQTIINLPPIGSISAETHRTPLRLSFTLTNIDLQSVKLILDTPLDEEITETIRGEFEEIIQGFITKILILAAFGGGIGAALVEKSRRAVIVGMIIGVILFGGLIKGTTYNYDVDQFQNPEFKGVVETAPWMIAFVEDALVKVNELSQRLNIIAENLYQVYQTLDQLEPGGLVSDIRVLHVSDIHNNAAAYSFVDQIANSFGVDFIINTGDETDFGTQLENAIFQEISELKVPYLYLGGNHDSPETLAGLSQIENVKLLAGQVLEVEGLRIYGTDDPASETLELTPLDDEGVKSEVQRIEKEIASLKGEGIDIIAVHNHRLAEALATHAPIIMHGHDHAYSIKFKDDSIILDAGTTGASGIRGLQTTQEVPYTVLLLHFSKELESEDEGLNLVAVDIFKVHDLKGGFVLERKIVNVKL